MNPEKELFHTINVHFEDFQELQKAFKIMSDNGVTIPKDLRRMTCCAPWPQITHLLHIQLERKQFLYCPPPFICSAMVSRGDRIYTVPEFERIAELGFQKVPRFPVFHVPHDGRRFPNELMADVCIPEEEFRLYHEMMRDKDARRMVPRPYVGDMVIAFEVSRLLCDVERFIGPAEIMEQYGMGFCYEKAYDGRVIKRVTDRTKALSKTYYDAHHQAVNLLCARHPYMVFFDIHSYTDEIIPQHAQTAGTVTPDLCIGTDPIFTPPSLKEIVLNRFLAAGFSIAENRPYSGVYVPEDVAQGKPCCNFIGIMLEFNRRAYCDENGTVNPSRLSLIQVVIRQIMADCVYLE